MYKNLTNQEINPKFKPSLKNISIYIRSILFYTFYVTWTLCWGLLCLPLCIFSWRITSIVGRIWAFIIIDALRIICKINYHIIGKEILEKNTIISSDIIVNKNILNNIVNTTNRNNYILASKHQSAWEAIFLTWYIPGATFIIKRELSLIPVFGWYLIMLKMILINRSNGHVALKQMFEGTNKTFDASRTIIIFPEGTRVNPSKQIRYKTGIASICYYHMLKRQAALSSSSYHHSANTSYKLYDVKVIPIALNSGLFWSKNSWLKFPGTITIDFMEPIQMLQNNPTIDNSTINTNVDKININVDKNTMTNETDVTVNITSTTNDDQKIQESKISDITNPVKIKQDFMHKLQFIIDNRSNELCNESLSMNHLLK